jgi:hypothetical protein
MEETGSITLQLRPETLEAFFEAARRAGLPPAEIVESLILEFIRKEGGIAFQSRFERGLEERPLQETFKVRIECEDELCRTPRIRMDSRKLEQGFAPAKRKGGD